MPLNTSNTKQYLINQIINGQYIQRQFSNHFITLNNQPNQNLTPEQLVAFNFDQATNTSQINLKYLNHCQRLLPSQTHAEWQEFITIKNRNLEMDIIQLHQLLDKDPQLYIPFLTHPYHWNQKYLTTHHLFKDNQLPIYLTIANDCHQKFKALSQGQCDGNSEFKE